MFNYFRKEIEWGGRPLILETGKVARQADGALWLPTVKPLYCALQLAQKT